MVERQGWKYWMFGGCRVGATAAVRGWGALAQTGQACLIQPCQPVGSAPAMPRARGSSRPPCSSCLPGLLADTALPALSVGPRFPAQPFQSGTSPPCRQL